MEVPEGESSASSSGWQGRQGRQQQHYPRILSSLPRRTDDGDRDDGRQGGEGGDDDLLLPTIPEILAENDNQGLHLVVHFDLNETVLVEDDAGGDSRQDVLNKMLAKTAYVRIPKCVLAALNTNKDTKLLLRNLCNLEPTQWWDGTPIVDPSCSSEEGEEPGNEQQKPDPSSAASDPAPPPPPPPALYTGWEWPSGCCPYYRTAYKSRSKTFVMHHGAIYRDNVYQLLHDKLSEDATVASSHRVPDPSGTATENNDNDNNDKDDNPRSQEQQLPHILPAFFDTLVDLSSSSSSSSASKNEDDDKPPPPSPPPPRCTATPRATTIVLRTFGSDLPAVAEAVTAFAEGQHPLYPRFCDPAYVLSEQQLYLGRWSEGGGGDDNSADSNQQCADGNDTEEDRLQDGGSGDDSVPIVDACFQLWTLDGRTLVASGDDEVLRVLHSHSICGVRDDYAFWKKHHQQPWAGKPVWWLMPMPPPTPPPSRADDGGNINNPTYYHHVLLDDNIQNLNDDSIAGIRKQERQSTSSSSSSPLSFRTLTGSEVRRRHGVQLVRVPTVEPVLDRRWFLRQIRRSLLRALQERKQSPEDLR